MIVFKEKLYTRWDDTDSLKKMRDSDILAEKEKKGTHGDTALKTAAGLASGGLLGSVLGSILGVRRGFKGIARGFKVGGRRGAILGGLTAGTLAALSNSKKQSEVDFYNERLRYAKRQALRREKADWKSNMTGREGYTY